VPKIVLLSVPEYLMSHDRDVAHLCDDLGRVMTQEQPALDTAVDKFGCPTGVDAVGHKTYPFELLRLHFRYSGSFTWAISLALLVVPF
jgi:hypothetical protein